MILQPGQQIFRNTRFYRGRGSAAGEGSKGPGGWPGKSWIPSLKDGRAPLDNNICERAIKKAVLNRKNAMFYRTLNGAQVGDLFMSLIHTCELNGVNPFEYLVALQQQEVKELKDNPAAWMPWNYSEADASHVDSTKT